MKAKTCCFTGHRDLPSSEVGAIEERLEREIVSLIERGVEYFGSGGARGFDTLAALTVLRLRGRYERIKLILVLPCRGHTAKWSGEDVAVFGRVLGQADKVVYVSQEYDSGCMHRRNRHLVDNSGWCVCYLKRNSGGTAYTVEYAKKKGLTVINCYDQMGWWD